MNTMDVLIANYLVILLINITMATFCLLSYSEQIYKTVLMFWGATLFNLLLQGLFQNGNLPMALAFSSSFLVVGLELKVLGEATGLNFPFLKYGILALVSVCITLVMGALQAEFLWIALPISVGLSAMMFHGSTYAISRAKETDDRGGVCFFAIIIIAHAIHMLDYPFLRQNQSFAGMGFSLALILLVTYSIYLPSFILNSTSIRYLKKVSELNARQNEAQQQINELVNTAYVGEVSFGVIHDMASPIQLINHYSNALNELQLTGIPNKKVIDLYSKGIENAVTRISSLQNMLRSYVKNRSKREVSQIDLHRTIENCLDLFYPIAESAGIELKSEILTTQSTIVTFVGLIDRVLLNLIQNAINVIKLSKQKRIHLSLRDSIDGNISILIQDSGPGIAPERLHSLWEKFGYSGKNSEDSGSTSKVKTGGSGFGLYHVKQMIEDMQGSVRVLDTSPLGTTFEIVLPRFVTKVDV